MSLVLVSAAYLLVASPGCAVVDALDLQVGARAPSSPTWAQDPVAVAPLGPSNSLLSHPVAFVAPSYGSGGSSGTSGGGGSSGASIYGGILGLALGVPLTVIGVEVLARGTVYGGLFCTGLGGFFDVSGVYFLVAGLTSP